MYRTMYISKSDIGIASVKINAERRSCFKDITNTHGRDTFIWDLQIRVKCRNKDISEKTFCMNGFTLFVRNFIKAGDMKVFGEDINLCEDVG